MIYTILFSSIKDKNALVVNRDLKKGKVLVSKLAIDIL